MELRAEAVSTHQLLALPEVHGIMASALTPSLLSPSSEKENRSTKFDVSAFGGQK